MSSPIERRVAKVTIHNRELPAGTVLTARFKKEEHSCSVEVDGEGKRSYLIGGKRFTSPSAAASSITGGSINGWSFWSVEGEAPAPKAEKGTKREPKAEKVAKAKTAKKPRAKAFRLFEKVTPNEGDPEGSSRFWCHGCQASFVSETDKPGACPKGHRADDPELTAAPGPEAEQEPVGAEA
jgi:hypothetical protein